MTCTSVASVLTSVLAGFVVASCSFVTGERPELGVSNGTALDVTIVINGQVITVAPAGGPSPEINETLLPDLPWTVEARSPTGRLLVSMVVRPGDVTSTVYPDGHSGRSGTLGRVDLSCGRLDLYAGPPALGPMPGPGVPGDCAP